MIFPALLPKGPMAIYSGTLGKGEFPQVSGLDLGTWSIRMRSASQQVCRIHCPIQQQVLQALNKYVTALNVLVVGKSN